MAFQEGNCNNVFDFFSLLKTFLVSSCNHTLLFDDSDETTYYSWNIQMGFRHNGQDFKILRGGYSSVSYNHGICIHPLSQSWVSGDPNYGDGKGAPDASEQNLYRGYAVLQSGLISNSSISVSDYHPNAYKFFFSDNQVVIGYKNAYQWNWFGWGFMEKEGTWNGNGWCSWTLDSGQMPHSMDRNFAMDHIGYNNGNYRVPALRIQMMFREDGDAVDKVVANGWVNQYYLDSNYYTNRGGDNTFNKHRRVQLGNPFTENVNSYTTTDSVYSFWHGNTVESNSGLLHGCMCFLSSDLGQVPIASPIQFFMSDYDSTTANHVIGRFNTVKYSHLKYAGHQTIHSFPDGDYYMAAVSNPLSDLSVSAAYRSPLALAIKYVP